MNQKPGPKSAADLAIVKPLTRVKRLQPPVHLGDAVRAVWLEAVNDLPASAFSDVHAPMLEAYAEHVVQARILNDQIAAFDLEWLRDDEGLKRYDRFLAMRDREVRAASSLATRLRITRQAAVEPRTAGRELANRPRGAKPWEPK